MRSSMVIQKSEIDRADDIDWHQLEAFIDQGIASCRQPMKALLGSAFRSQMSMPPMFLGPP